MEHERCRFCGSTSQRTKPLWGEYWFVACNRCKAAGPIGRTPEEAWDKWDGRWAWPDEAPTQARMFYSEGSD